MKDAVKETAERPQKFTKGELIRCRRWNKYALMARLKDEKKYSIAEVERLIGKE